MRSVILAGLMALAAAPAMAQDEAQSAEAAAKAFVDSLQFKTGDVLLPEANATLHANQQFRFLDRPNARRVLEELWGNPPDDSILGMLVPTTPALTDDHSWAVVITYSDDGYISDEDAAEIDYNELLTSMQEDTRESSKAREQAGYGSVELRGWAAPPRYDATSKKLYWAQQLKFGEATGETLNYDVRVLGREGYLSMNAIANMDDLTTVQSGMQQVLQLAEFNAGARYADFNSSTDKVAGYGLAALVGGVAASKMGLFAKLGALLLAGKKLIIPIVIGIGALLARIFKKKGAA